jgi:hypothetical protein
MILKGTMQLIEKGGLNFMMIEKFIILDRGLDEHDDSIDRIWGVDEADTFCIHLGCKPPTYKKRFFMNTRSDIAL